MDTPIDSSMCQSDIPKTNNFSSSQPLKMAKKNSKKGHTTWDELIKSHPRQGFGKLKDNLFMLYNLAHQVFSGTFATGELAKSEMPDLMDCPLANITPSNRAAKKTSKAKRPAMILDPDDSDNDLDPTSS
ncbi:hypothetical protein VP01_481g1, partial [Puccinia sorghi]